MLAGFVPQSLGSPAAPPTAGDLQDVGVVAIDADGAAAAGSAISAFGEALASACEAAAKAAGEELPEPVSEWSRGLPGVWLDLAGASAAETDEALDSAVEEGTVERQGPVDPSLIVTAPAAVAAAVDAPASARPGTFVGLAGDVAAAERIPPDTPPAVQEGRSSDRPGAVVAAGSPKAGGPPERIAMRDDPAPVAIDRQPPAAPDVPAGEQRDPAGARTALPAERERAAAEPTGQGRAPSGGAPAGVPAREPTAAAEAVAASPALPPRSASPTPVAGRAVAAAGDETGHATPAAPSVETETRQLPDARGVAARDTPAQDAPAQDAPAHDHRGDRGHAPPNESGARGANSDTLLQRSGVASLPAFGALITAADGTLRLGAPLPTAAAGAAAAADEQIANLQRMVQTMRVMVRETVSQATVRLRPEHLGEVTIDVRVDGKSVSAVIHSESANVREWMQGQESTLRQGLSEHGLHLEKLQVQRDGRQDGREGQQQPERRKARARQHDNTQGTFEITV
jgi:hypothetical protein